MPKHLSEMPKPGDLIKALYPYGGCIKEGKIYTVGLNSSNVEPFIRCRSGRHYLLPEQLEYFTKVKK